MKIKVMQITHDLAIGGLQQVIVNLCRSIDRTEFDISILCLRELGEFVPDVENLGIKVHFLSQKESGTDYFSFLKVAKILRREKIDVIHTHNTQPFVDGTIAAMLSGVRTVIHTDHARSFPDKFRYMFAEWLMSHYAFKVVGVSGHTSENLTKYEKISPKKIMTIENGIDGTRFDFRINRDKKREEIGIKNNGPVIGLGVRLAEQKGIKYLLQTMPRVIQSFPDVNLVIVGDGELKTILKNYAVQLGIQKNVLFLGPRLDIPEFLKLFDIYVLPSLWEGMPMVLLEAMAAGCPIIATDVGGVSKVIDNELNGILVPPANTDRLGDAIVKLLQDDNLRKIFSQRGKEKFINNFSAKIMTRKYEKLYLRNIY